MVRHPSHPALSAMTIDGNLYVDYPIQSPFKTKPMYGGIERIERVAKKVSGVAIMTPPTCFATFAPTGTTTVLFLTIIGQLIYVNNFSGQVPFSPQKVPRYYDQLRVRFLQY
jgi:hypothetical protein